VPGLPPADCRLRRAAVLGAAGRPGPRGRAMRYREDTPAEQARARAAVQAWRQQNPGGRARSWSARSAASFTRTTVRCSAASSSQRSRSPGPPRRTRGPPGERRRRTAGARRPGAGTDEPDQASRAAAPSSGGRAAARKPPPLGAAAFRPCRARAGTGGRCIWGNASAAPCSASSRLRAYSVRLEKYSMRHGTCTLT
jgi:hypothetical protein